MPFCDIVSARKIQQDGTIGTVAGVVQEGFAIQNGDRFPSLLPAPRIFQLGKNKSFFPSGFEIDDFIRSIESARVKDVRGYCRRCGNQFSRAFFHDKFFRKADKMEIRLYFKQFVLYISININCF